MRDKTTSTGLKLWSVDYERDCFEEATAHIHYRIPGFDGTGRVSVAVVDCLPVDTECEDAEQETNLVREGDDADRLRNVCLIVHAPEMLDTIRRCVRKLDELCDGAFAETTFADAPEEHRRKLHAQLQTEECWELWRALCEIQRELGDAAHPAVDLETV